MKKYISMLIGFCFLICSTTAFAGSNDAKSISVVTTIFPVYDWVKEITSGSDSIELTLLLDKGVDLHNYQPTVEDLVKISSCDLFIYVGGESDEWVEDALAEATNKEMKVINLLEALGDNVKEEELVEGMEAEEEEEDEEEGEEGPEYDEHVWLSLKNAQDLCNVISETLCEIDPDHRDKYSSNVAQYSDQLSELDQEYSEATASGSQKTILFGDRFPFRYMADDYELSYYAAFVGCSAETEASFETILFLAGKVDEIGLQHILTIEGSDGKIAQTIADSAKTKDIEILEMNSLQSTTKADADQGVTYLSAMQDNLEVLKTALE